MTTPNFVHVDTTGGVDDVMRIVDDIRKPCVVLSGEPIASTAANAMAEYSKSFETRRSGVCWIVCPRASEFALSATDGQGEWRHIRTVDGEWTRALRELTLFALVANEVRSMDDLVKLPPRCFLLAFDPASSRSVHELVYWRHAVQSKRFAVVCATTRLIAVDYFARPGIYRW